VTVSASTIARVRLMVNERTDATYSDAAIEERIVENPLPDASGIAPEVTGWVPTYDLYLAAANIWNEKAAALADRFDFSADGASFDLSKAYENALKMVTHYTAQSNEAKKRNLTLTRKATSHKLIAAPPPRESPGYYPNAWIGNEAEPD